jgi:cysteine desulfurase
MEPIFLDYNSTTPTDPEVLDAMIPYFSLKFGNPASKNHLFGIESKNAVDKAREQIASLVNCHPKEIVFTSGATESINLALKGYHSLNPQSQCAHLPIEHKAVMDVLLSLKKDGLNSQELQIHNTGIINLDYLTNYFNKNSSYLIIAMHANNEIGVIQPIKEIVDICKKHNSKVFCDAAQSVGKIPVDVKKLGVDMLSISAHKFYGPKGIGALYINRESKLSIKSQIDGGGHEFGFRSGTLNVPSIVGFGKAAELAKNRMSQDMKRITKLRDMLLHKLNNNIDNIFVNGTMEQRLPNNVNVSFSGLDGDSLLINIDDIAVSNGAACSSMIKEPSYVLKALGLDDKLANSSIRFGIGRETTEKEINYTVKKFISVVENLREIEKMKSNFI